MRLVRAEMLEVLRSDYIKFARARGLATRSIHFGHALKNTLVPVITVAGLQFGGIVAFSIVTETVFQWPGMGLLLVQSIQVGDIPVMSTYLLLVAVLFVIINLVVDLLYFAVDPRLRVARGELGGGPGARQRPGLRVPAVADRDPVRAGGGDLRRGGGAGAGDRALQPVRPGQPEPDGQLHSAGLPAGGKCRAPAGDGQPGAGPAVGDDARRADQPGDRAVGGGVRDGGGDPGRSDGGLLRRGGRRRADAGGGRAADVPVHPDRAAGRAASWTWRCRPGCTRGSRCMC